MFSPLLMDFHQLPVRTLQRPAIARLDNRACLGRSRNFLHLLQIQRHFFSQALRKLIDYECHIYNSQVASRLETCNPADGSLTLSISCQISFYMCFSVLIWIGLGQKLSLHLSILIACRTNGLHVIYQQDFIS